MKTAYVVEIVPVKESKSSFILGVYTSLQWAKQAAKEEIAKPDASWWTEYKITRVILDLPRPINQI